METTKTTIQEISELLRKGIYSVTKSEPLTLKDIDLDDEGDEDSKDINIIINVGGLTAKINDLTVYFELATANPRKVIISDTEFDDEELVFTDSQGIEVLIIPDKEILEEIKKNIRPKLVKP